MDNLKKYQKVFVRGVTPSDINSISQNIKHYILNREYSALEKCLKADFVFPCALTVGHDHGTYEVASVCEVIFFQHNKLFRELFCKGSGSQDELAQLAAVLMTCLEGCSRLFDLDDLMLNQLRGKIVKLYQYGRSLAGVANDKYMAVLGVHARLIDRLSKHITLRDVMLFERANEMSRRLKALPDEAEEYRLLSAGYHLKRTELRAIYSSVLGADRFHTLLTSDPVVSAARFPALFQVVAAYKGESKALDDAERIARENIPELFHERCERIKQEVDQEYAERFAKINPWVDKFRALELKMELLEILHSKDPVFKHHRGLFGAGWKRLVSNLAIILFPPLAAANIIYRAATGSWFFANKTRTERRIMQVEKAIGLKGLHVT